VTKHHHSIVQTREFRTSDYTGEFRRSVLFSEPSRETLDWLEDVYEGFLAKEAGEQGENEAQWGAICYLAGILDRIRADIRATDKLAATVPKLPDSCFVAGGGLGKPAHNKGWNEPPEEKRQKR